MRPLVSRELIRLMMKEYKLISDSFGTGEHGEYLVDLAERIDVVVECFLFETPKGIANDEAIHQQIARQGMKERSKQNEQYFENLKRNVIAEPERFMNAIDPNELGPNDRFCIQYDIQNATSSLIKTDDFFNEYMYAFTDPPYGLRCKPDEKNQICIQTLERLFGDINDFIIRKWSTNWSTYFNAGNEWWGAFLWTLVADNGRGWWVGASTTD